MEVRRFKNAAYQCASADCNSFLLKFACSRWLQASKLLQDDRLAQLSRVMALRQKELYLRVERIARHWRTLVIRRRLAQGRIGAPSRLPFSDLMPEVHNSPFHARAWLSAFCV